MLIVVQTIRARNSPSVPDCTPMTEDYVLDETPGMVRFRIDNRDDQGRVVETLFFDYWGDLPMTEEELREEIYQSAAELGANATVRKVPLAGPWLLDVGIIGSFVAGAAAGGVIGNRADALLTGLYRRLTGRSPSQGPVDAQWAMPGAEEPQAWSARAVEIARFRLVDIEHVNPNTLEFVMVNVDYPNSATVVLDTPDSRYSVTVGPNRATSFTRSYRY